MIERQEYWPAEIRKVADLLTEKLSPSYPGEAAPIDLLREVAEWFEQNGSTNDELQERIYNITEAASENFETWHRLEFGEQVSVDPDIRTAYIAGHRYAYWKGRQP